MRFGLLVLSMGCSDPANRSSRDDVRVGMEGSAPACPVTESLVLSVPTPRAARRYSRRDLNFRIDPGGGSRPLNDRENCMTTGYHVAMTR